MTDTNDDFTLDPKNNGQGEEKTDIDRLIDSTEADDAQEQSTETPADQQTAPDGSQREDTPTAGQQHPSGQPDGNAQGQQGTQPQGQGNSGAQDITLRDGSVIKGGATRRIYERGLSNERLEPQLRSITQERDQLKSRVDNMEQSFRTMQNSGLNPQEGAWAHQIVAAFKQDPVKTLNHLLTQVKAAGYDTSQFGQGVDANVLREMLAKEVGPLRQNFEQEQQQRQIKQQGEQMYNQFVQSFPAASKHEDEIAQLMERGLEPQAAYYALRSEYLERGLDFNLSLQENVQKRATQQGGQQGRQPIPHGRGNTVTNPPQTHQQPMASENDSWDQIIRSSLS